MSRCSRDPVLNNLRKERRLGRGRGQCGGGWGLRKRGPDAAPHLPLQESGEGSICITRWLGTVGFRVQSRGHCLMPSAFMADTTNRP